MICREEGGQAHKEEVNAVLLVDRRVKGWRGNGRGAYLEVAAGHFKAEVDVGPAVKGEWQQQCHAV